MYPTAPLGGARNRSTEKAMKRIGDRRSLDQLSFALCQHKCQLDDFVSSDSERRFIGLGLGMCHERPMDVALLILNKCP